jgi:hypothetical protein
VAFFLSALKLAKTPDGETSYFFWKSDLSRGF